MTDKTVKSVVFYVLLIPGMILYALWIVFIGMPWLVICDIQEWYGEKKAREKEWEEHRKNMR